MSGQRFVYDSEWQRHERFVGRAELLARLDRLLVDPGADCWVVVTGGPGMGKSAILATWLAGREAAGATVPHHFIRRGAYNWPDGGGDLVLLDQGDVLNEEREHTRCGVRISDTGNQRRALARGHHGLAHRRHRRRRSPQSAKNAAAMTRDR